MRPSSGEDLILYR